MSEATVPGIDPAADAIIQVRGLRKWYEVAPQGFAWGRKSLLKAVDDVSFDIERGRSFGLVGESGCGKTTTLKLLLQLERPTEQADRRVRARGARRARTARSDRSATRR